MRFDRNWYIADGIVNFYLKNWCVGYIDLIRERNMQIAEEELLALMERDSE